MIYKCKREMADVKTKLYLHMRIGMSGMIKLLCVR